MILEEEKSFASKCTTPEELEIILRSNLIELPNCRDFAEVFIKLGVTNVIFFETNSESDDSDQSSNSSVLTDDSKRSH
jgi:hypothetical protein